MAFGFSKNKYRFGKARSILHSALAWYKKESYKLPDQERNAFAEDLKNLDKALLAKNRETVDALAAKFDNFLSHENKKSTWSYAYEIAVALVFALIIASIVRLTWFENQEIPTGSMRPTYMEQDKLLVSKTAFGINVPMSTSHFYFDPSLIQRTGIFIFSVDGIPMHDSEGSYFGIFPYKKRLIKRVMGLPGDTIYFYGGKIYGINKEGKPIDDIFTAPWMKYLEYVPFLTFSGQPAQGNNALILKQMGISLGRLPYAAGGLLKGQIHVNGQWVKEDILAAGKPHDSIQIYSDFWGFNNYGMVQLLKKEQIALNKDVDLNTLEDAELYLEIRHTPNLTHPLPYLATTPYGMDIVIPGMKTYLPMKSRHLNSLMDALYTARFVVEGGKVRRYSAEGPSGPAMDLGMQNVPDGTYEFYHGKAYSIAWGGISTELPSNHPIYDRSLQRIQYLFNYGIDFNPLQTPKGINQFSFPHRYAYFREGDLFVMGNSVMKKDDPFLKKFIENEQLRQKNSASNTPYIAFLDHGPPVDSAFIKTFGLQIPEKHYLALGDNHAMSGDSRVWGFVPENNIQGAPSFLYWPAGSRMGFAKNEPSRPCGTLPNIVIWSLAALVILSLSIWHYRKTHRSQLPKDFT